MAVALVTGASSGIGLATAVTLARGGHAVIATMRNLNAAGELRKMELRGFEPMDHRGREATAA
jgi:NAD(P)-dependent dehydrogenase (short-subunit alcohol dehydrogenase family)